MAIAKRPNTFDGAETRPMTDDEWDQYKADVAAAAAAEAVLTERRAERDAVLRRLGLSDQEIQLILGG